MKTALKMWNEADCQRLGREMSGYDSLVVMKGLGILKESGLESITFAKTHTSHAHAGIWEPFEC